MSTFSIKYTTYLQSKEWAERRLAKLQQAKYKCQYCKERDRPLTVHHLSYEHLGDEDSRELLVLCSLCHWVADELRKNPDSLLKEKLFKQFDNPRHELVNEALSQQKVRKGKKES